MFPHWKIIWSTSPVKNCNLSFVCWWGPCGFVSQDCEVSGALTWQTLFCHYCKDENMVIIRIGKFLLFVTLAFCVPFCLDCTLLRCMTYFHSLQRTECCFISDVACCFFCFTPQFPTLAKASFTQRLKSVFPAVSSHLWNIFICIMSLSPVYEIHWKCEEMFMSSVLPALAKSMKIFPRSQCFNRFT